MVDLTREGAMTFAWRIGWWLLACVTGLAIGFALASGGFYLASAWNNTLVVRDLRAETAVSSVAHQRQLAVHFHVDSFPRCPSLTQHSLYQDKASGGVVQRTVIPLGVTVNGLGSPGDKSNFVIPFTLPPTVTTGAWAYVAITSSSCEWFPGFVRQQVQETTPIDVFVPGPA